MSLTNEEIVTFLNAFQTSTAKAIDKLHDERTQSMHKKEKLLELYGKLSAIIGVMRFIDFSLAHSEEQAESNYTVGKSYPELGGVYTGIVSHNHHVVLADQDNSKEENWHKANYYTNDWILPTVEQLKQLQVIFDPKTTTLLYQPFSLDAFYWSGTLGPHGDPHGLAYTAYAVESTKGDVEEFGCFHKLKVRLIKLVPRSN